MTPEKLQSIAFKWFDCFNNKELEKLLSLYDDDAMHSSPSLKVLKPESNGLLIGKQALREYWQDSFEHLPSLTYMVKSITANADRVFIEYTKTVESENDIQIAEVLDIKEDKIIASRVYLG